MPDEQQQQQQQRQQQQQQQADGKQSELVEGHGLVNSPQLTPVHPPMAVVETTWKPTILVVDDSSMNRKVKVPGKIDFSLPVSIGPPFPI